MEPQGNGPDASSIKPVSSLLSKFENLQKDPDAPKTPISGQRQFSLGSRVVSGERPQSAGRLSASPPVNRPSNVAPIAIPRARRLSPPRQRPVSMAAGTPPQLFPPLVTVDSPKSPPVDFARESRLANTIRTASPATASPTGSRVHSRNLSRSTTPALEQRMSAFLVDSDFIKPSLTGNGNAASVSNNQATTPKLNGPPPLKDSWLLNLTRWSSLIIARLLSAHRRVVRLARQ
jgi:hypothetical protein